LFITSDPASLPLLGCELRINIGVSTTEASMIASAPVVCSEAEVAPLVMSKPTCITLFTYPCGEWKKSAYLTIVDIHILESPTLNHHELFKRGNASETDLPQFQTAKMPV